MRNNKTNCTNQDNIVSDTDENNLSKILRAYKNDNFDRFDNILRSTCRNNSKWFVPQIKPRTKIFDKPESGYSDFDKILCSNDPKASKYIHLVLKYFDLWSSQEHVESNSQKPAMYYVIQSEAIKNLFTYLIFDWFHPESCQNRNYCLELKAKQFFRLTGRSLLETLYDIIDDEDSRMFRDVCLRIIYQLLYELEQEDENLNAIFEVEEHICFNKVLAMKDQEYRDKILQIFSVFWMKMNEYKDKILNLVVCEESQKFFNLVFLLTARKNIKFEKKLEEFITMHETLYGDYASIKLKPHVRLLNKITEGQRMHKTCEFIFAKCPYTEINSTIMTNFYDVQDFRIFNLIPFNTKRLKELVIKTS